MSELVNIRKDRAGIRLSLLATASAFVLASCVSSMESAQAADDGRPTVWVEGGLQYDSVTGRHDPFVPPLNDLTVAGGLPSLVDIENTGARSFGAEGSISLRPKGSDWVFVASALYGRTHSRRYVHQEKDIAGPQLLTFVSGSTLYNGYNKPVTPIAVGYVDQAVDSSEAHAIVDFQVGKDIGVGLLGRGTDSVISFGARYVQFNVKSDIQAYGAPDARFVQAVYAGALPGIGPKYRYRIFHHASAVAAERSSNAHGLGPSISLSNTTALLGDDTRGQLAVDWGVNAAVLFGRQRVRGEHQSSAKELKNYTGIRTIAASPVHDTRSRSVIIPNVGGFAGISYRFPNAKLSAGYRADFFFGALDRGLDERHSVTTGFHGPFATVAIGLGG